MPTESSTNGHIRAALYARASTDKQTDSVPGQLARLRAGAAARGRRVVLEESDDGISGGTTARPGLQRLLAAARAGAFAELWVDALDRLARLDILDLGEVLAPLRRAGIKLLTLAKGEVDLTTMAGRLMAGLAGEQGAGERENIARRALNGMRALAAEQPLGGPAPYGYRWRWEQVFCPKRKRVVWRTAGLEIIPEQAEVVLLIYQLAADGYGRPAIIKHLWEKKIPSPSGKPRWNDGTLGEILTSDVYLGSRRWNRRGVGAVLRLADPAAEPVPPLPGQATGRRNPREKWVVKAEAHDPIVTAELAARARVSMTGRLTRKVKKAPVPATLAGGCLSGLVVCGRCGEPLFAARDKHGRRIYQCSAGGTGCVRCAVLEEPLLGQVLEQLAGLATPVRMKALRDEVRRLAREQLAGLEAPATKRREQQLRAKIDGALERLPLVSKETVATLDAKVCAWRRELEQLEEQRREVAGAVAQWEELAGQAERLVQDLAGPEALARALADPLACRRALGKLVRAVEVAFRPPRPDETDGRRKLFWDGGTVVLAVGGTLSFLASGTLGSPRHAGPCCGLPGIRLPFTAAR
jgi:site-specific DNA recombinase